MTIHTTSDLISRHTRRKPRTFAGKLWVGFPFPRLLLRTFEGNRPRAIFPSLELLPKKKLGCFRVTPGISIPKKTTNVQKNHRFRALLTALDLSCHHLSSAEKKAHLGNVKKEAWSRNKTIGAKRKENSFGQTTAFGTRRKKNRFVLLGGFLFPRGKSQIKSFRQYS